MTTPFRDIRGTFTALVTPFGASGDLDEKALFRLVDFQLDSGIDGLVICGTTGEESSLTFEERCRLIELVQKRVDGRVPIVAGAFGNVTKRVVELARVTAKLDVDAVLSVVPYYVRPNQRGISEHFLRIAEAVEKPVILSNVPSRTGSGLDADTVSRLAEHENIRGIDDSSGDLELVSRILAQTPEDFRVYSGEDTLTLPMLILGAEGAFSLVSNEAPRLMKRLVDEALSGNLRAGRELHFRLFNLMNANTMEPNPIPVKAALSMMGLIDENYRLPLVMLESSNRAILERALSELELLPR